MATHADAVRARLSLTGQSASVDPATLPRWLRSFVDINPVSSLVSAVRALMHGAPTDGLVLPVLLACAAMVTVFAPLTMRAYRRER